MTTIIIIIVIIIIMISDSDSDTITLTSLTLDALDVIRLSMRSSGDSIVSSKSIILYRLFYY